MTTTERATDNYASWCGRISEHLRAVLNGGSTERAAEALTEFDEWIQAENDEVRRLVAEIKAAVDAAGTA